MSLVWVPNMKHTGTITKYFPREGDAPAGGKSPERKSRDYVYVAIPKRLVSIIDRVVEKLGYRSRNEFVVDAVRKRLEELGLLG